jgi:aspartyl-tRNA(Asn)/glutamyl-tRNA(Gln) amidotransferase subunit C
VHALLGKAPIVLTSQVLNISAINYRYLAGKLEKSIMSLTKQDVENIAHLARLAIDEADIPEYANNLSNILELVEQMTAIDTTNVEPMAHPLDAVQRLRKDEVTEENQREHYQQVSPLTEAGLFLVPKVIE